VSKSTAQAHGVLTHADMLVRFARGEIFVSSSWSEGCLRGSAYDLRMATDFMVVPDRPNYPTGRFYPKGSHRERPVILSPGDAAFISTVEKCCLPWDVTGTIGPKFSLTAGGLLILTGLFVDPGYGLVRGAYGDWTSACDQRLHFLIANVGSSEVALIPGQQKIAAIQFTSIDATSLPLQIESRGLQSIEEQYLQPETASLAGLVFFRNVAELKSAVERQEGKFAELETRVSGVEAGSNQVVMFGVFLLCVTFLGAMFQILLSASNSDNIVKQIAALNELVISYWPGTVVGLIIAAFAALGVLAVLKFAFRLLTRI
jgi:deoxycytidine triphosphate deaminase